MLCYASRRCPESLEIAYSQREREQGARDQLMSCQWERRGSPDLYWGLLAIAKVSVEDAEVARRRRAQLRRLVTSTEGRLLSIFRNRWRSNDIARVDRESSWYVQAPDTTCQTCCVLTSHVSPWQQSEPAGTSSSAASMSSAGRMKLLQALADVPLSLCRAESDDEDEERLDDTEAEVEEDEAKSYRANAIATLQTLYGSDARRADDDEDDGAARKQEQGHSRHDEPAKSRQQARLESRAHELVILARLTGQSALHPRIIGRDTAGPRASTHSSSEQPGSMGSEAPAASMEPLARQCLSQLLSSVEADGIREGEEREDAVASLAIYALRTHIRQAFSNKPTSSSTASATPSQHPRVSSTTGRAMQRPTGGGALAGGNVSMNDVNSPQATWRSSPAIDVVLSELLRILPDSTIRHRETTAQAGESTADAAAPASNTGEQEHQRRCQRKRREVLDQAWPAVIPPLATLLDDHDARAKLAGARALDVLLDKVDGEILERTGIGQLFFNVRLTLLGCFSRRS